jgi:tetratricopeptide (TPR) repeat protein
MMAGGEMGFTSSFAGGLVSLVDGGVSAVALAAITGAVGDDVCKGLMARMRDGVARIDDPAALPANHHFLRVLRHARLQAIGTIADETRRELSLDENGSPFLRAVTAHVGRSLKDDPNAALDPRELIAREVGRAPTNNTGVAGVRGVIDAGRALSGVFARRAPVDEAHALFTDADRIALVDLHLLVLSPARLKAAQEAGEAWAAQAPDERCALTAGLQITALAELVEALDAADIDWAAPAPAVFRRRFEGTNRGYAATLETLIHNTGDEAFNRKLAHVLAAEIRVGVEAVAQEQVRQGKEQARQGETMARVEGGQETILAEMALLRADFAAVQAQTGVSRDQAEGLLAEIETSGLPVEAFRAALFGGARELKALGEELKQRSNLHNPALEPLRLEASQAVDEGRLDAGRAALESLSREELAIAEAPLRAAAEAQARLGQLERSASRYLTAADHFARAAQMLAPIDAQAAAAQQVFEGIACTDHGQRFPDLHALKRAIASYESALLAFTRESAPLDWAMTQNGKASALLVLGERTGGPEGLAFLEAAVLAYDAALAVRTRESAPSDWAKTQNNKAAALRILGGRASGSQGLAILEAAVSAFDAALEVCTRESAASQWAGMQNNKAIALSVLAERADGSEGLGFLEKAVSAYDAALEVRTRESAPLYWAMTQNNKAIMLRVLGERAGGLEGLGFLEKAVSVFDAVLEVYTRDSAASYWAMTCENKAVALLALVKNLERDRALAALNEAEALCDGALEVYTPHMAHDMETATRVLADIRAARAALNGEA